MNSTTIKRIIIVSIIIVFLLFSIVLLKIFKPKYELNKSISYIKDGNFSTAYLYINKKNNESNTRIIKELISLKLIDNISNGCAQLTTIATKGTEIFKKVNINNIDYSLDDNLNIYVEKLEDYIKVKNDISKDMIIEPMYETYDLYFSSLKFVNENFTNILNYVNKDSYKDFMNEALDLSKKMETIAVNIQSLSDNYTFLDKTRDLYKEIN